MVVGGMPDPATCYFCGDEQSIGSYTTGSSGMPAYTSKLQLVKVRRSDGTVGMEWVCADCDPKRESRDPDDG